MVCLFCALPDGRRRERNGQNRIQEKSQPDGYRIPAGFLLFAAENGGAGAKSGGMAAYEKKKQLFNLPVIAYTDKKSMKK